MIKNTEKFAEWIHNNYETISKEQNWNTQKNCQVEFKDLPARNKAVMIRIAERIKIQFHIFFDNIIDKRLKDMVASNIIEDELLRLKEEVKRELRNGGLNSSQP